MQTREDAEECVSETWLKSWNAIPPERPRALRNFLGCIARNTALTRWAAMHAQKRGGGETAAALEELAEVTGPDGTAEAVDERLLEDSIAAFLRTLSARDRRVFLRRYYDLEPVPEIARRQGLREEHVRVLLSRTRRALREHLEKEGYTL